MRKDLSGMVFGKWEVISYYSSRLYVAQCECGNFKLVKTQSLVDGRSKSCGCLGSHTIDEVGHRYGKLLIVNRANSSTQEAVWHCLCDCGNSIDTLGSGLRNGRTVSCGCYHHEVTKGNHGDKASNWKGGVYPINKLMRHRTEQLSWVRSVFERDNYICQDCGIRGGYLEAHHLFGFSNWSALRVDVDNGITLCKDCHDKYNKRGSYDHENAKFIT